MHMFLLQNLPVYSNIYNMIYLKTFNESVNSVKFVKQPSKKGAKTETYNVVKSGITIGQVKWYSRLRGYGFLPTADCNDDIKSFISDLMAKRRKNKKPKN